MRHRYRVHLVLLVPALSLFFVACGGIEHLSPGEEGCTFDTQTLLQPGVIGIYTQSGGLSGETTVTTLFDSGMITLDRLAKGIPAEIRKAPNGADDALALLEELKKTGIFGEDQGCYRLERQATDITIKVLAILFEKTPYYFSSEGGSAPDAFDAAVRVIQRYVDRAK